MPGFEEWKHSCSQPGPKGHARPSGCKAWAGGSQPRLPDWGLSLGPCWPDCKGEAKQELVPPQRCLSMPLPLPSAKGGKKAQEITLGGERGPRDHQGL